MTCASTTNFGSFFSFCTWTVLSFFPLFQVESDSGDRHRETREKRIFWRDL